MDAIISALVTGGLSLLGVIFTTRSANKKTVTEIKSELATYEAVTNTKIDELTREVREHNNFAKRMPVVENEVKHIDDDIKHINADIKTLQSYHTA